MFYKNTASKFYVYAYTPADGLPKTGDAANITAYVAKDFGAATVLADTTASEVDATNAPGLYVFDAAQGETNADVLMVSGKSSTSGVKVLGAPAVIYTMPTTGVLSPATLGRTAVVDANGLIDANTVKVGPSGSGTAQTAGDIPARLPAALGANGNIKADLRDSIGVAVTSASGRPEVNTTHLAGTAYATAAAALVQAVWDAATSALTTVGSIGKKLADWVVGTIDTYTGNTKQTGDAFARIGAAGAGLTALGDSRIANLDATVSSRGTGTALTAADVRTALGLAAANLDTQLDALPTNAELATALAAADDAVLAAIAALNNLSAAQVNAEVVDALRTDTGTEVSSVPAAAAPISAQIQFLFQALRNKVLSGASLRLHNDAGTIIATKVQTDDGTTYSEQKAT